MRDAQNVKRKVAGEHSHHSHVHDVRAHRQDAAILKYQGLYDQDRGHHQTGGGRPQCDAEKRRAHQMAAGANAHREIDDLRRKDERAHHAEQRHSRLVEAALRLPGHVADGWNGHDVKRRPNWRRKEAVRNVHGVARTSTL